MNINHQSITTVSKTCLSGLLLAFCFLVSGCITPRPHNVDSVCAIFKQYPKWYWATQDVHKKWGVPISVQMAIMHQESHFNGDAKPPRTKLLWIIPWKRPSSAYGYSQAIDQTWKRYQRSSGEHSADRDEFADAADFVGWYAHRIHKKLGIPINDAKHLYLAYHEGTGSYARGSYHKKPWLVGVSNKVQRRANRYHQQLKRCESSLPQKPWWHLW